MNMDNSVVVVDMARSAFTRGGRGVLSGSRMDNVSVKILKSLLEKNNYFSPDEIGEFGLGQVFHAEELLNLGSAQIAQLAGLAYEIPKFELNRQCGSSMEVIHRISHAMNANMYDIAIAMGVERMDRNLSLVRADATKITRLNPQLFKHHTDVQETSSKIYKEYFKTEIPDYLLKSSPLCTMLQTGQNVADMYAITRQECDEYAFYSHEKYKKALKNGVYDDEIVPLELDLPIFTEEGKLDLSKTGEKIVLKNDDAYRDDVSSKKLAALNPVKGIISYAKNDIVITPGNSCPTSDGVSVVLLMSLARAKSLGVKGLAKIIGYGVSGIKPQIMGVGPVIAIKKALKQAQLSISDIDFIEFNEAFSSQVIATMKELDFPLEKVNINGGSLAIGHPLGATGARLVGTCAKELARSGKRYAISAQCIGAGMGIATVLSNF